MAQLQLFQARDGTDPWTVRVSRRARRLSVRVYPGGRVEVVVPPGASAASVQRFVGAHRRWIDQRIEDLSADAPVREARPSCIELPAIGQRYQVSYEPADGPIHVREEPSAWPWQPAAQPSAEGVLRVRGALHDERALAAALRDWLMALALPAFGRALHLLAQEGGFTYRRVQIRRQRTRWGSCSASGTISLNVCVIFLRPQVLRYLLVHELCHTRHMNHSARFWSLVARHEPDYERLDRELLHGWRCVPGWMFD